MADEPHAADQVLEGAEILAEKLAAVTAERDRLRRALEVLSDFCIKAKRGEPCACWSCFAKRAVSRSQ